MLSFNEPESLNHWPLPGDADGLLRVRPDIAVSSGETLRRLAVEGVGITCLSDFVTDRDRAAGTLVPVLATQTLDVYQPIHAVYYRNTAVSARISSFLDYLGASDGAGVVTCAEVVVGLPASGRHYRPSRG